MRPEKIAFINQIKSEIESSEFIILADVCGLEVAKTETLRNQLADIDSRLRIVKNTMFKRVAEELEFEGLGEALTGPTAMVFGTGDVVTTAKILKEFAKVSSDLPKVKAASLAGKTISSADVKALADLPSKEIMQGQLVATIAAPMTGLVGVFQQKISSLVYVLTAAIAKEEEA